MMSGSAGGQSLNPAPTIGPDLAKQQDWERSQHTRRMQEVMAVFVQAREFRANRLLMAEFKAWIKAQHAEMARVAMELEREAGL